jgi:cysteine-rich repeat protein
MRTRLRLVVMLTWVGCSPANAPTDAGVDSAVAPDAPQGDARTCGDGHTDAPTEQCDDGNVRSADGCDAQCRIEPGFTCSGDPLVCAVVCGDGKVGGRERCDDGGLEAGDGCSRTCEVEPGYACSGEPSTCATTCGDGSRAAGEECDDHNSSPGDGCSATCTIEEGWSCDQASPTVCAPGCGNGTVDATEACDDGNAVADDGCTHCIVDAGFVCTSGTYCVATCGDGSVAGWEQCDDGNDSWTDGCTPLCLRDANGAHAECVRQACDVCDPGEAATTLWCEPGIGDPLVENGLQFFQICGRIPGIAAAGPAAGTPLSTLCLDLLRCIQSTGCMAPDQACADDPYACSQGGTFLACLCGSEADQVACLAGSASGACKQQIFAAAETFDPDQAFNSLNAFTYANGAAHWAAACINNFGEARCP